MRRLKQWIAKRLMLSEASLVDDDEEVTQYQYVTNKKPPYTMGQKQRIFSRLIVELIEEAYRLGYEISLSEAYRTPQQAEWNAKKGKGIKNSLHTKRLAIDLNLFKGGKWLQSTKAHAPLGKYWESLSGPGYTCHWGGHFGDGNHYSIGHGKAK